jgi:hypothetical protein
MKLKREFYKLPIQFDVARLVTELGQYAEQDWREHPQKYQGNSSIPLITVNGGINDDIDGPMAATEYLLRSPYLQQVLASFDTVFGRSRLMRLAPGAEVPKHNDVHYYWHNRVRIHIPIITEPPVRFFCGSKSVHMAAGEAWIFDSWRPHRVINPGKHHRIHLVADTVGTAAFWEMVQRLHLAGNQPVVPLHVPYQAGMTPALRLEQYNQPVVMPPAELDAVMRELIFDLRSNQSHDPFLCGNLVKVLDHLRHEWQSTWVEFGASKPGWPVYAQLLEITRTQLAALPRTLTLASTGYPVHDAVEAVLKVSLNSSLAAPAPPATRTRKLRFERPVFIIAAPRSGSTLLFETLATNREFWTVGDESHRQIESIPALHPAAGDYASNRLDAGHAGKKTRSTLLGNLVADLRNSAGQPLQGLASKDIPRALRLLEKTPKNALRIPFLQALFPDARFIYLYRNPRDNLSSLLDAWRSGHYRTYPELPGWEGEPWSLLLVPGWRELVGRPLAEIVAAQWKSTHATMLDDLAAVPQEQWCMLDYADLLQDPTQAIEALCRFSDVPFGERMQQLASQPLRPSRYTLSAPDPEKWRRNAPELEVALPLVGDIDVRIRERLRKHNVLAEMVTAG